MPRICIDRGWFWRRVARPYVTTTSGGFPRGAVSGENGSVLDERETPFGIRAVEFRRRRGLFINDVPVTLKGVCLHHDAGPLGAAVPENVWEYRLSELRKIGCNAIRTSHNPPAPEFLDLCDRMGFLVMDEFCDKWEPPHYLAFETRWRNDIASWVRRDRTHPSVILWSVGNENDRPGTPYLDDYLSMRCAAVRVIGLFYWTGIDYLGEAYRSWPHIAMTGRDRYPSF